MERRRDGRELGYRRQLGRRRTSAGNALTFSGTNRLTTTNNFAANTSFNGIKFDNTAGAFTLNGNPINLGGDVVNNSGSMQTINLAMALQQPVNFNAGTGTLLITGSISGEGPLTISGGTLALGNPLALQNSTVDISSSGAFSFGSLTSAAFGGLAGAGPLSLVNSSSGAVPLSVGNDNASTTYSGLLTGGSSLTKVGSGTLTLTGTNTYSGVTIINGGAIVVTSEGASPGDGGSLGLVPTLTTTADVVLNGGTLEQASNAAATLSSHRGIALGPNGGTVIDLDTHWDFSIFGPITDEPGIHGPHRRRLQRAVLSPCGKEHLQRHYDP